MHANPRGTIYDENDKSANLLVLLRDPNDNPKREPGPINIQKTVGGFPHWGTPTFFCQPVAIGPEDSKAGNVEVALMGAPVDLGSGMRGTAYGPQAVRTGWWVGRTYKVHLDGYNFLPHLTGQEEAGPRKEIFYFSDDGDLTALRYLDWKLIFMEQRATGTLKVWSNPFTPLRLPLLFHLRRDMYERAQITSNTYYDWALDRAFLMVPAQAYVGRFLATFKDFPPRQKAASFTLEQVIERLTTPSPR